MKSEASDSCLGVVPPSPAPRLTTRSSKNSATVTPGHHSLLGGVSSAVCLTGSHSAKK